MSELADTHASEGQSVRSAVESAFAEHSHGPDVESAVNNGIEQRDREVRSRSREQDRRDGGRRQWEGETSDKRRADIRNALNEEKIKTAQRNIAPEPIRSGEVPIGAPPSWDTKAKAAWDNLPVEARLAVQRDHAAIKPRLEQYAELDRTMAPVRDVYRQQGVKSDAEALQGLLKWEAGIRNPATRLQTLANLMQVHGVSPHDLIGGSPQQYQQYQQQPSSEHAARADREVSQFTQGGARPHFEAVRATMGEIITANPAKYLQRDGSVNLDAAYRRACQIEGLGGSNERARAANVSPAPRAPAAYRDTTKPSGSGVRASILNAFAESRQRA